jgi:hypothetical protein
MEESFRLGLVKGGGGLACQNFDFDQTNTFADMSTNQVAHAVKKLERKKRISKIFFIFGPSTFFLLFVVILNMHKFSFAGLNIGFV